MRSKLERAVQTFVLIATLSILGIGTYSQAQETIRVTGIPDENPTELMRKNQPLVDYLEEQLGTKVKYIPVTDYGAAVSALVANKIDFAWLGGFTHVQARVLADAEPLIMRDIDREFKSVFIKHISADIKTPEDFKGKTFAFGSKSSTSGHLMPRYFMQTTLGIDPEKDLKGKPVFSGAHDATVKLVESGKIQGGALNFEVWNRMIKEGKVDTNKVKRVWTTPGYVDYVWTTRKSLDEELKKKFKDAFLNLDANKPKHRAVLRLQGANKYVTATKQDFDSIEKVARETGLLIK